MLDGYLSRIKIGRPNFEEIFETMRDEVAEAGEHNVAVLTCGPTSMVNDVFYKAQKYSKPFYPKVTKNGKSKNSAVSLNSVIEGRDFKIKVTDKQKIKNKKYRVKFDFHTELFEF